MFISSRRRSDNLDAGGGGRDNGQVVETTLQPTEFSFDRREWYRLLRFLGGLFCVSGFLAGVLGGHSWTYTMGFALALPAFFVAVIWLSGYRDIHRSYVVSADGILLRCRGRNLEHIALDEIAEVRPWPLAIILHSGRKISFALGRSEMLRARDALLQVMGGDG